jgi:O-antigen/teichoic acid export membrane protein
MEQPESTKTEFIKPRKSVAVNMIFGFLSWILPGIVVFFSTPIIVKALGANDYGIYALIFGFISYSLSFSIGKGVTKYVAEYKPSGDHEKINDIISATLFLSLLIGIVAAIILSGGAGWLVKNVFQIEDIAREKSITSFYLAAAVLLFYLIWQVFSSIVTGLHRFDVYSYITTLYGVLLAGGNIVLALSGFGLVALFWWSLFTNVLICLVSYSAAKMLYPEMRIKFRFARETLSLVLKYSSGVILGQIFANILLLFERGLITRNLGPENLTYYVIPMTLAIYIHAFIGSFIIVIFPIASELGDQKDKQIILYERATKIVVTLVVFIAVTMITASNLFLTKWVGAEIAQHSAPILVIQVIIFSLLAIEGITWQLAEGLGFPNYNALLCFSWLVIGGGLMIVFIPYWGGFGVGVARLIGVLTIPFSIIYVERWLLGKVRWKFWAKLLSVLFVAGAFTWLVQRLLFSNMAVSWLTLFVGGATGAAVYGVVLLIFGWYTQDEKELFNRLVFRA